THAINSARLHRFVVVVPFKLTYQLLITCLTCRFQCSQGYDTLPRSECEVLAWADWLAVSTRHTAVDFFFHRRVHFNMAQVGFWVIIENNARVQYPFRVAEFFDPAHDFVQFIPVLSTDVWGHHSTSTVLCLQRSEEHTSELQSRFDLVCRLLLEKKKIFDQMSA